MISYILYVCIVLFLTYLGYFFSGKYRHRKSFYIAWEQFHQNFLSEIGYTRRPLKEVIEKFKTDGYFSDFLTDYNKNHAWDGKIDFFNREENEFLSEYFSFLGKSDYLRQKEYFNATTKRIEELKEKSEVDAKKHTDLYVKLGFLLGLIIVILLV